MIRQFAEISSWRQHNVTIEPHEVYTLNFRDTTPNIFVVNNPNLALLKVGISSIPRTDSYEFKIEYNTTETFGRPIGTNNVYILNDSSIPVKIVVFSIVKDFEPSLLKNMNVALEGYTIESSTEIADVKDGVVMPVKLDDESKELITSIINCINDSSKGSTVTLLSSIKQNTGTNSTYIRSIIDAIKGTSGPGGTTPGLIHALMGNLSINSEQNLYSLIENGIESLLNKSISVDAQASVDFAPVTALLSELVRRLKVMALESGHYFGNTGRFYNKNNETNKVLLIKGDVTESLYVHFDWFYNDSETPVTLYTDDVNDVYVEYITIMPHEKIENLTFQVIGDRVCIKADGDVSYRSRYWVKEYSDFYAGN